MAGFCLCEGMAVGDEIAISLKNVSKCFKRYERPIDRLKEVLIPGRSRAEEFWALRDVSLEIPKGQTVGIIGRNGSGKSTLLQIIAGTMQPTNGAVRVNGRVSALLELGSGFNPEFTGRQNVFFNGQLLGLDKEEIEKRFDDIESFADIGGFIDEPLKTYSSGMFVRLAFSVAINVSPEILIVDEALSVGDGVFVHRCMAKIKEFQDSGGTILFVSHDTGSVSRLCSSAVWLRDGEVVENGSSLETCNHYQAWMYDLINIYQRSQRVSAGQSIAHFKEDEHISNNPVTSQSLNPYTLKPYVNYRGVERFGTGRAEIESLKLLNDVAQPVSVASPGEIVNVEFSIVAHSRIRQPVVGCTIYDRLRTAITAWNTHQLGVEVQELQSADRLIVTFRFEWPSLNSGSYTFEPAVADGTQDSHEMLDWLRCAAIVDSSVTGLAFGIFSISNISTSLKWHSNKS